MHLGTNRMSNYRKRAKNNQAVQKTRARAKQVVEELANKIEDLTQSNLKTKEKNAEVEDSNHQIMSNIAAQIGQYFLSYTFQVNRYPFNLVRKSSLNNF